MTLVRLPNERPECNDIKLGDCLRLLRTHRGRTIVLCNNIKRTERGGYVVMHETRIREVPDSNLLTGQAG